MLRGDRGDASAAAEFRPPKGVAADRIRGMMTLRSLLVGLVTLVALDFLWIGTVAADLYRDTIGPHLHLVDGRLEARVPSAVATWVCIVLGLALFALPRARAGRGGVRAAAMWGAVYGFFLYGVYDLTNHALFHSWPARIVAVDMTWGTTLCAAVAAAMMWSERARRSPSGGAMERAGGSR